MTGTQIVYHLPTSFVLVDGTRTSRVNLGTGARVESVEVDIALGVEADTNETDTVTLDLERSGLADTEFTLTLTDDGRLTSASGTSTGRAGTILSGAATLVGIAAGAALQSPVFGLNQIKGIRFDLLEALGDPTPPERAAPTPPAKPAAPSYTADHPEMARRLATATDAANQLSEQLVAAGAGVAAGTVDPARLYQLRAALGVVRNELAVLQQHKAAWVVRTIDEQVTAHTFRIPIGRVPILAAVKTPADREHLGATLPMLDALGMIVARDDRDPLPPAGIPRSDVSIRRDAVIYRRPHYTDLVLLRAVDDRFVEIERTAQLVMSDRSPVSATEFDKSMWGKKHLAVEFSPLGSLTSVATDDQSSSAEALAALGRLPIDVTSGMTQAGTTAGAIATLRSQRLSQAIARLELEKKHKELTVLDDDAPPNADLVAEIGKLELELKRLQLESEIGKLEGQ